MYYQGPSKVTSTVKCRPKDTCVEKMMKTFLVLDMEGNHLVLFVYITLQKEL